MEFGVTLYVDEYEPVWELKADDKGNERDVSVGRRLVFEGERTFILPTQMRELTRYIYGSSISRHNGSYAQVSSLATQVRFIRLEMGEEVELINGETLHDIIEKHSSLD